MKKKPTKTDKKRVIEFLRRMQYMFALQNYDRTLVFKDEPSEDRAASVYIEEDYQRIRISIYPCFWENDLKNQAEYLLHEFCHYLVLPLDIVAYNALTGKLETAEHRRMALEKSVSSIANILDTFLMGCMKDECRQYQSFYKAKKKKRT